MSMVCSFLSSGSGFQPAAGVLEVVCHLFWCRLCPRFWRRGCSAGGRDVLVREVEVTVMEVKGEKDVADRHFQAAPAVV